GVIWIAVQGQDRPRPAWHIWRAGPQSPGAAYVVTGPGEQPLPGLAGSGRVTVIVPRGAGAGPVNWTAEVSRVEPGSGEWDEVIGPLVAGRLNAVLAEGETSAARRWARSGAVFRLAPLADDAAARNSRTVLSAASPAVHPWGRLAGHRQRRNSDQRGGFSMHRYFRSVLAAAAAGGLCLAGGAAALAATAPQQAHSHGTATPIQHVVVIFQENVSFDHYFGTYPRAANTDGNPFHALAGTPSVNGLTPALLNHNPNSANPQRLTPAQALTCDQDHAYTAEQQAMNGGLMDKFVEFTNNSDCSPPNFSAPGLVMDYYDGNTVTGLWNYAQHYAMSDNFYDTEFGPSTPGALNLVSGQTGGATVADYSPHHNPFEYYKSTANPDHTPPASVAEIGHNGPANHEYDLSWFFTALDHGNMPAVSYLKAAEYQDGHAGYSDPTDEQHFLVNNINAIQRSKFWHSTAIMVTYDDSDGWYDHQMPPIINSSADPALDALNGTGVCGNGTPLAGIADRCGYGQRLPFLLISPYAKTDYVSGTTADQTSLLALIEDNWLGGQRTGGGSFDSLASPLDDMFSFGHPHFAPYLLDPATGEPAH
ncbi:MAG TPA: alkaline phosphatase family protein, partial [Streptosporangiaceae bacterium]